MIELNNYDRIPSICTITTTQDVEAAMKTWSEFCQKAKKIMDADTNCIALCMATEQEAHMVCIQNIIISYKQNTGRKPHVITTRMEDPSVLAALATVDKTYLIPNIYGCVVSEDISAACKLNTCLIVISHINGLTGARNNMSAIHKIAEQRHIPVYSLCSHAVGYHKLGVGKGMTDVAVINMMRISSVPFTLVLFSAALVDGYKLNGIRILSQVTPPTYLSSMGLTALRSIQPKHVASIRSRILRGLRSMGHLVYYDELLRTEAHVGKNDVVLLVPSPKHSAYGTIQIVSFIVVAGPVSSAIRTALEKKKIYIYTPGSHPGYRDMLLKPKWISKIITLYIRPDTTLSHVDKFFEALRKVLKTGKP